MTMNQMTHVERAPGDISDLLGELQQLAQPERRELRDYLIRRYGAERVLRGR